MRETLPKNEVEKLPPELQAEVEHTNKLIQQSKLTNNATVTMSGEIPDRYLDEFDEDDFIPPERAQAKAQRILDIRAEHDNVNGGTDTGWSRAEQIAAGIPIPPDEVQQISAWFARHPKSEASDAPDDEPWTDNGWTARMLWGWDQAKRWADALSERLDAFEEQTANDFEPELHPRDSEGKFAEIGESLSQISDLAAEVQNGETADRVARRKMEGLVRDETGVSTSLRTLPGEIEKAARASQEMIRLGESEDLSGLDEFRVSSTSDDLKGLRGVASGRYKIRDKKIILNPDQFEQDVIDEWRDNDHTIQTEPESIIRHEVGHYLHGEKVAPLNPDADVSWDEVDGEFDEETADRVEEVLGEYAATMPGEFIAEAYTYQKEGGVLPDDLQELYSTWNGPEVN